MICLYVTRVDMVNRDFSCVGLSLFLYVIMKIFYRIYIYIF